MTKNPTWCHSSIALAIKPLNLYTESAKDPIDNADIKTELVYKNFSSLLKLRHLFSKPSMSSAIPIILWTDYLNIS